MKQKFKKLCAMFLLGIMSVTLHPNTVQPLMAASGEDETFSYEEDAPVCADLPPENFTVTPTGWLVKDVLSGTGSYFNEIHNLFDCTGPDAERMAAYCLNPARTAPTESTIYTELSDGTDVNAVTENRASACAVLMYGYGGDASINNEYLDKEPPNPNIGGSYGLYVIDGVAKSGLLINSIFYELSPMEACAVTAASIHKLNGSDIQEITGTWNGDGSNANRAMHDLYQFGAWTASHISEYGYGATVLVLNANTSCYRQISVKVQNASGEFETLPSGSQTSFFDWSPYFKDDALQFEVSYTAVGCESGLVSSPQSGDIRSLRYTHDAAITFADAPQSNGYYDYFSVEPAEENEAPVTVRYQALQTQTISTPHLGYVHPDGGGFESASGVSFTQRALITVPADSLKAGQTLSLIIRVPEAFSNTPLYGDGDGRDGSFNSARFFAAPGYQNLAVCSPLSHHGLQSENLYASQLLSGILIYKASEIPDNSDGNKHYSLTGGIYALYGSEEDANAQTNIYETITLDKNGMGICSGLPYGTYYLREKVAPEGYALDDTVYPVSLNSDVPLRINVTDEPITVTPSYLIYKKDEKNEPLAEAYFEVCHYDEDSENPEADGLTPNRRWVLKSDDDGVVRLDNVHFVSGDAFYTDKDKKPCLPLGTLTVREIKAPYGYICDDTLHCYSISSVTGSGLLPDTENARTVTNYPLLRAFQFTKYGKTGPNTKNPLANAGFMACNISDLVYEDGSYVFDASKAVLLNADGSTELFTDENGYAQSIPIPLGTYLLRETTVPEDYLPIDDFFITVDGNEDTPLPMYEFTDELFYAYVQIEKTDAVSQAPIIRTPATFRIWSYALDNYIAFDYDGENFSYDLLTGADGMCRTPFPLAAGKYRLEETNPPDGYYLTSDTTLDFTIGTGVPCEAYVDESENTTNLGLYRFRRENTPLYGTTEIWKTGEERIWNTDTEDFDTTEIPLRNAVFELIAAEDILSPDGQGTVLYERGTVIEILTTDGEGYACSATPLAPGNYILHEQPMDGYEELEDIPLCIDTDGTVVEQESNGKTTKRLICSVSVHNRLKIPEISTQAIDAATQTQTGSISEQAVLTDLIHYKNLIPGKSYTIKGILIDKACAQPLLCNEAVVEAEQQFICEAPEGDIAVSFILDSSKLYEKEVVLYENLYSEDTLVCVHADINNTAQTITYPKAPPVPDVPSVPDTPPTPDVPKTGDTSPIRVCVILAFFAVLSFLVCIRRKAGLNRNKSK